MENWGLAIVKLSPDGTVVPVAGGLDTWDPLGVDGPGSGLAVDGTGDVFVANSYANSVLEISPQERINSVGGNVQLNEPFGVALDGAGNLFVSELGAGRIRKVSTDGVITTIAGNASGYSSDGGPASAASFRGPGGIAADRSGAIYVADTYNNAVRVLRPTDHSVVIASILDAASQRATPISPGKIFVITGAGLGPGEIMANHPEAGVFGSEVGGTTVSVNGILAPILYTSATQVEAIVPYSTTGPIAQITVTYQGEISAAVTVPVVPAAPAFFTLNQSGAGQAAATNAADGSINSAVNPVKIGDSISLYATGAGQSAPAAHDGEVAGSVASYPILPVSVTIGGIPGSVQYAGSAPGEIAGLMQVNVRIPNGVQAGGYVPVVLKVGNSSTIPDAVWIAVSGN